MEKRGRRRAGLAALGAADSRYPDRMVSKSEDGSVVKCGCTTTLGVSSDVSGGVAMNRWPFPVEMRLVTLKRAAIGSHLSPPTLPIFAHGADCTSVAGASLFAGSLICKVIIIISGLSHDINYYTDTIEGK